MFIQSKRRHVVAEHVQEGRFSALSNLSAQDIDKPACEAIAAKVLIDANRADLDVSGHTHPFAGHRNETTSMANADVIAHLDRSLAERARLGSLGQIEHLIRIRVAQADDLSVVRGACFVR